jgi:hypothetical protein
MTTKIKTMVLAVFVSKYRCEWLLSVTKNVKPRTRMRVGITAVKLNLALENYLVKTGVKYVISGWFC